MVDDLRELSQSYREPQKEPSDHCYTVLQDHGPNDGGWGPAAVVLRGLGGGFEVPRPFVYTGSAPHVIEVITSLCRALGAETGKPTIFAKYTQREDVFVVEGSS